MRRRTSLTLDRHRALGEELKEMQRRLISLGVEIGNTYGSSKTVFKRADKAALALRQLRSELDSLVCGENPNEPDLAVIRIYYGGSLNDDQ